MQFINLDTYLFFVFCVSNMDFSSFRINLKISLIKCREMQIIFYFPFQSPIFATFT